jgi:hypothetical protein
MSQVHCTRCSGGLLGYIAPTEYPAACRHTRTPVTCGIKMNPEQTSVTLEPGGLSNGTRHCDGRLPMKKFAADASLEAIVPLNEAHCRPQYKPAFIGHRRGT